MKLGIEKMEFPFYKEILKIFYGKEVNSNFKSINKISIIGGPGTGKSTLANNLGKELKLPIYHLDGIHYLDNWKMRNQEERDKIFLDLVNENKWVIDGTYKSTLEKRVEKSDMVIFLNYSTLAKLKGIFSRYHKTKGKERPEIPGCKENMNLEFIKLTINWNKTKRKLICEILEKNKDKKVIVFKNRRSLNKWYKNEFKKKIEV